MVCASPAQKLRSNHRPIQTKSPKASRRPATILKATHTMVDRLLSAASSSASTGGSYYEMR